MMLLLLIVRKQAEFLTIFDGAFQDFPKGCYFLDVGAVFKVCGDMHIQK